jgi:hypothetical protein
LVFWFRLFLGFGVVVVVDVVSAMFGVEWFSCLVVVVSGFCVHNNFLGTMCFGGFLVWFGLWVAVLLCKLSQGRSQQGSLGGEDNRGCNIPIL